MTRTRRSLLALLALAAPVALAACQGAGKGQGPLIHGTLISSSGSGAPLTLGATVGSVFSLNAVLDSANIVGTSTWHCYAPDPANGFPNYDMEGTDNTTFGLFVSVDPSVWTAGTHTIDGVKIQVVVATPDRFGSATNGLLVLTTAGTAVDTAGSTCAFYTTGGISLTGHLSG